MVRVSTSGEIVACGRKSPLPLRGVVGRRTWPSRSCKSHSHGPAAVIDFPTGGVTRWLRTAPAAVAVSKLVHSRCCAIPLAMTEREWWTRKRDEAQRELDAAKGRTAINAAAQRLQHARAELMRLDQEQAKRRGGDAVVRCDRVGP
jgi:hypothetical protein